MRSKLQKLGLIALGICVGVMITLNFSAVAQSDAVGPLPVEELRTFTEVFGRIKSDYVEPVDDKKLISDAISGMVAGLDPHSAYLDKDEFRDTQIMTQGEFGGLGIEVGMEDGLLRVISPIDDTPAARAGIKPGDLIVKLDDVFVSGLKLEDAVKQMRGKPNTKIILTIERKGEAKPLVLTLTRAIIKVQSVKSTLLEPGYAYFRITQFDGPTGEALADAIQTEFKKNQGSMKGVVLDLRNDPGGLLNGAVAVSAAFLPQDSLVVYTKGRTKDAEMRLTTDPVNYLHRTKDDYLRNLPSEIKTVPMVVLVNGGTASASEIVAGALQDHKRAVIMGATTFGKASVQTILPLGDDTAIKLTTARYYTPNGRSIQAKGIIPDIALDDGDSSVASLMIHEGDLTGHLSNDGSEEKAAALATSTGKTFDFTPAARPKNEDENDLKPAPGEVVAKSDYDLSQAIAFLKSRSTLRASSN